MKLASALLLVLTLCVEADVAEAAGRIPYGGVVRVSLTPEAVPTWRDSVSDCFLFQRRAGELSPELASDRGRWQDDSLL